METYHKFAVGDILVVHSVTFTPDMKYNGEECEVLQLTTKGYYEIKFRTEEVRTCHERFLMRKPPSRGDMDTKVLWKDCPWQPDHMRQESCIA